MKLKINKSQLQLLADNFVIVEGEGLKHNKSNLITEGKIKEFAVKVLFGGWHCYIRVGTQSSGSALMVAKMMFPKATVTSTFIAL
jgi:hypothetical protein